MDKLEETEILQFVNAHPRWRLESQELVCDLAFAAFPEAIGFVNRAAELAEAAGHHPDIDIRYNRVRLALTTHDAGGITAKDLRMAEELEKVSAAVPQEKV